MSQKLITVFGATGNQGGSVISAILSSPKLKSKYKIRAITRDPKKESSQALASKGAEVTKADLSDESSLQKAIEGSYAVFAVTNYWETMDPKVEFNQGKNIVDASKAAGVKHFVWSTLPDVTKLTNGELSKVEHFDSKASVADYAEGNKGDMVTSYYMPAFFMSNMSRQLNKDESGTITISLPWNATETKLPMVDIRRDTGYFVMGLIEAGPSANGVFAHGVSEWTTPKAVADTLTKVAGKTVQFKEQEATAEGTAKIEDKVGAELAQNMLLIRDYSYYGKGTEKEQDKHDKYFLQGVKKMDFATFADTFDGFKF